MFRSLHFLFLRYRLYGPGPLTNGGFFYSIFFFHETYSWAKKENGSRNRSIVFAKVQLSEGVMQALYILWGRRAAQAAVREKSRVAERLTHFHPWWRAGCSKLSGCSPPSRRTPHPLLRTTTCTSGASPTLPMTTRPLLALRPTRKSSPLPPRGCRVPTAPCVASLCLGHLLADGGGDIRVSIFFVYRAAGRRFTTTSRTSTTAPPALPTLATVSAQPELCEKLSKLRVFACVYLYATDANVFERYTIDDSSTCIIFATENFSGRGGVGALRRSAHTMF